MFVGTSICCLAFNFLNYIICSAVLMRSNLSVFSFLDCSFAVTSMNFLPSQGQADFICSILIT